MEDPHVVREKALRLAVRTGVAPDLDFVWAAQERENGRVCFGAFQSSCARRCRWYDRCRALTRESVEEPWTPINREDLVDGAADDSRSASGNEVRWLPPSLRGAAFAIRRRPPAQPAHDGRDL